MAAEAQKQGYRPNNGWERMLRRHLEKLFPETMLELQREGNLEAYLQSQTWDAMELASTLEDQGTDPHLAREAALEQLLPTPPEEQDRPEEWETEDARQPALDIAKKVLSK